MEVRFNMRFFTRLRFFVGIIFVIAVVAALFVYLNYTMSNISSRSATLETDSYAVTNEYDGVLRQQFVHRGYAGVIRPCRRRIVQINHFYASKIIFQRRSVQKFDL